jgi:hypothetical protein
VEEPLLQIATAKPSSSVRTIKVLFFFILHHAILTLLTLLTLSTILILSIMHNKLLKVDLLPLNRAAIDITLNILNRNDISLIRNKYKK